MKKIRFVADLYIDEYEDASTMLTEALHYGSKHQDFVFILEEVLSVEDAEEE